MNSLIPLKKNLNNLVRQKLNKYLKVLLVDALADYFL